MANKACYFRFRRLRHCTIYVAKTKALISCAVTMRLIWAFVFANAKKQVFLKAGLLILTIVDEKKTLNDPPSITELIPLILPVLSTQPIINHSCLQISAVYHDNLQPAKLSLGSFTVMSLLSAVAILHRTGRDFGITL